MDHTVAYIIDFLIGENIPSKWREHVGYTDDPAQYHKYQVVIRPSQFFNEEVFGTKESLPTLPLPEIEGIPLLFGTPTVERIGSTLIVHADIIAGSFFLLSRYEEVINRDKRDKHSRFPGKESLPYRGGFIHRPIVEEYGKLLRQWLRDAGNNIHEPENQFSKIWLTHDVDAPFYCRSIRQLLRESLKGSGLRNALSYFSGNINNDPYFTFPWLLEQDKKVTTTYGSARSEIIYFIKSGGKGQYDKPFYPLPGKDSQHLLSLLKNEGVSIGLHSSYHAGLYPEKVITEKELLEKATGRHLTMNRHHFLSLREPEDYDYLEKAGITDDFTMGYADVAGFRLGTCRSVNWISPLTKSIHNLRLHPLMIMDVSLSEPYYHGFDYQDAFNYCMKLIKQVKQYNGELSLLWHNDVVAVENTPAYACWLRELYTALIKELTELSKE